MIMMSILGRVCIRVLGFYKLEALGVLKGSVEFSLFGLRLRYCVLAFVCLMQSLSCMMCMGGKMFIF